MPVETTPAAEAGAISAEELRGAAPVQIPTLVSRNRELFSLRDTVLLAACRIAGSLPNAEDIVQEAYIRAVQVREPLLSGGDLRNWFLKITVNAARDFLRSEKSRKARERSAAMQNSTSTTAQPSADSELKERLELELAKLDEKYRTPLSFHFEQGLTYDEAAYVLDIPAGTVRWQASEGLRILRERLTRPENPVSAEIVIAALAAGAAAAAFKCSPALASAAEAIVAKSSTPAMKIFSAASAKSAWAALALKIAAGAAVLIVAGWIGVTFVNSRQTASSTTASTNADVPANAAPPAVAVKPAAAEVWVQNPDENIPPQEPRAAKAAVDYAPPPEVETRWTESVELLPQVRPERDSVAGNWSLKDGELRLEPQACGRIALPYLPPEEYDFRADFTRVKNDTDIAMILSINGQNHLWLMDAWQKCGFGGTYKNPDAVATPGIANGVRHSVVVEVRKSTLSAYLDGKLLKSIVLWKQSSAIYPDWRLPDERLLGVGGWNTGIIFHRIAVRAVSGEGKTPELDTNLAAVNSAEHWIGARDLLPKNVAPAVIPAGRWARVTNELRCAPGSNVRMHFSYIPPEEYDYKIEFTRNSGEDEVVQILSANGRQFAWKVGARGYCFFDTIDGRMRNEHGATLHTPGVITTGQRVTSVVSVRKDGLRAYVNGRLMAVWRTRFSDMNIEKAWQLPSLKLIGVGAANADVTFHTIELKEITGTGSTYEPKGSGPRPDQF